MTIRSTTPPTTTGMMMDKGTPSSAFSGDPLLGLCVALEEAVVTSCVVLVTKGDEDEAGASVSAGFVVTDFSVVVVIAAEEIDGVVLIDEVVVGVCVGCDVVFTDVVVVVDCIVDNMVDVVVGGEDEVDLIDIVGGEDVDELVFVVDGVDVVAGDDVVFINVVGGGVIIVVLIDVVVVGEGVVSIDLVVDGSNADGDAVVDFVDVVVGDNVVVFIDVIGSGVVSLDDVVVVSVDVVDGDGVGASINVVVIGSDLVVVIVDVRVCSDVETINAEIVAESDVNTSAVVVVICDCVLCVSSRFSDVTEDWVVVLGVVSGDKVDEGVFTVVLEGNLVVIASDLEVNDTASVVNASRVVVWSEVFVVIGATVVGLGVVALAVVNCVVSSVVMVGGGAAVVEFAVVTGGVDALVAAGVVIGSVGRGDVEPVVEGGRVGKGASSPGAKHCTCNLAPESSDRRPIQYLSSFG